MSWLDENIGSRLYINLQHDSGVRQSAFKQLLQDIIFPNKEKFQGFIFEKGIPEKGDYKGASGVLLGDSKYAVGIFEHGLLFDKGSLDF